MSGRSAFRLEDCLTCAIVVSLDGAAKHHGDHTVSLHGVHEYRFHAVLAEIYMPDPRQAGRCLRRRVTLVCHRPSSSRIFAHIDDATGFDEVSRVWVGLVYYHFCLNRHSALKSSSYTLSAPAHSCVSASNCCFTPSAWKTSPVRHCSPSA